MSTLARLQNGVIMAVIELPCYGIVVKLPDGGGGSIESNLHTETVGDLDYNAAINGLESLILAHACAGIDIEDPKYIKGIKAAVEAIENNS